MKISSVYFLMIDGTVYRTEELLPYHSDVYTASIQVILKAIRTNSTLTINVKGRPVVIDPLNIKTIKIEE